MKLLLKAILILIISAFITYGCIVLKIDWNWAVYFNTHNFWVVCAVPFVILGMVVPLAIPLLQYILYRKQKKESRYLILAKKSFWSFILAYFVMTILKVFTNRVDMEPFEPIGVVDFSNQFRFGFMNSNHWWESFSEGWPSGHTMIAVAMAISINNLLKNRLTKVLNVVYPICIALSVSTAFHWLSDVISGLLFGLIIGFYFRKARFF